MSQVQQHAIEDDQRWGGVILSPSPPPAGLRSHVVGLDSISLVYGLELLFRGPLCIITLQK